MPLFAVPSVKSNSLGLLAGLCAFLIWGFLVVFWHMLDAVAPFEILCYRIVFSFVSLLPVVMLTRRWAEVVSAFRNRRVALTMFASSCVVGLNWFLYTKIANYHFTTLYPNLGVVWVDEGVSFVMADIPGIIEGASEGAGLGHDFLRHIDRCRLLVHLVDVSGSEGRDPIADFNAINEELRQYSPELATRPQIVVANKTDLLADPAQLDAFRAHVEEAGYAFMAMSAATHQGTRELVQAIAARLAELPPVAVYEPEYVPRPPQIDTSEPLSIQQEDNTWLVEGPWLQRLMANINFSDYESRMYFDKMLRQSGLFDQLERMGIQDGDIVSMYNLEFEYQR